MLVKAAKNNLLAGMMREVSPHGIISMQYVDDTFLFLENNLDSAKKLKWLLSYFEQMSGMRINFHKYDPVPINVSEEDSHLIAQALSCGLGSFPLKYLGFPLHYAMLRKEDLQTIIAKILKRAAGWRGRLLGNDSKLILVQSCLASIPSYLMSAIKFPKWVVRLINSQMAHCFGDNFEGHHKYHLANWYLVTQKKEFGGLDISNIADSLI